MTAHPIVAHPRLKAGKSASRTVRKEGFVPGVVYGNHQPCELVSLDPKALMKEVEKSGFFSRLFSLSIEGKEQYVLAKDIQLHPVSDRPLHIDFHRVSSDSKIIVNIPVSFSNEDKCPGLKKGGTLNIVHHTLEVLCPALSIPESLTIDLGKLEINQGIHLSDLTLPEGVSPKSRENLTLVTIVGGASDTKSDSDA